MLTQSQRVLEHMKKYGSITPAKAWDMYGITRLAARIKNLRDAGYDIDSTMIYTKDRKGRPTNFARYTLNGGE